MASWSARSSPSLNGDKLHSLHAFKRDVKRSYGRSDSPNMLVHGDNLDAMEKLASCGFKASFRCIYVDPPYNTGRVFTEYKDALSPSDWRDMMHSRFVAMRKLLANDGAIVTEIDDTELGPTIELMDSAFGREHRVSTVTIIRSAGTGHKAKNKGPVNVADYLLIYAKDKSLWRANRLFIDRHSYDKSYSTYIINRPKSPDKWAFEPLASCVARSMGFSHPRAASKELGKDEFQRNMVLFALNHSESVVRFAQPRYEAVSTAARSLIDISKADHSKVYRLKRTSFNDMFLYRGNRILFLADKVRIRENGPQLVEPLTNVWNDIPFQGIAKEGGIVFSRNKKPERLIERILSMTTNAGDWVLDPFLGSGTTAAVAHKMSRNWIGIERGAHLDSMCIPRLRNVIDGNDSSGITRSSNWQGGGGFGVFT